jgi:membrane protease YdiL (CAAX protease family)
MEDVGRQEDSIANLGTTNAAGGPWGIWWTLLFSGVIALVYMGVSLVVALGFSGLALHQNPRLNVDEYLRVIESNGLYLSVATIGSAIVCGAFILLFAKLRRGITVSGYLRLTPVPAAQLLKWVLLVVLFIVACDVTNLMLGRAIVPKFMSEVYASAGNIPLLWFALVIAAPFFEELFFRGFLFAGLIASRLGAAWTIAITAFVWGAIHMQYEIVDVLAICMFGLILGLARVKTDSVYTPIVLHSFTNLVATIETAMFGRTGS